MERGTIWFVTVRCALGWLLVARTERGVCNVRFGSGPEGLEEGLRAEFPWAELVRDAGRLASSVAALERYLNGETRRLEMALDVRGSQFQRRVWDAIRAIPYGDTRTYGELARAIGRPTAVRALAQACGANPVAVVVPCHRVVGARGSSGGYRWGPARKRALLELEKESDLSLSFSEVASGHGRPRDRREAEPSAAGP